MCSPELSQSIVYVKFANKSLKYFVKQGVILFGNRFCIYNVHSLLHLSDDMTRYGPLDQNSSFKYENYFQFIKKLVRNGKNPLTQITNRLDEFTKHCNPLITKLHSTKLYFKYLNNFYIYRLSFCQIIKKLENKVICKIYVSNSIFNFLNFNSTLMGCLVVDRNNFVLESVKFSEIGQKWYRHY